MDKEKFKEQAEYIYNAAVRLWSISDVERHAEGHPGYMGSAHNEEHDAGYGYLQSAINCLRTIEERVYGKENG
jgi:hypothetical protein